MSTVVSKLTDLARKIVGAKEAVRGLRDADRELRQAHAAALEERGPLLNDRPAKAEITGALEQQIDAIAREWRAHNGDRVVHALAGGVDVLPSGEVQGIRRGDLLAAFVGQLTIVDLISLCPDQVKATLSSAIEATAYEAGPPMAARPALIAKIDERIAGLEAEHTALCDDAAEAGVGLAYLDDVRSRRAFEAHRAEVLARTAPR